MKNSALILTVFFFTLTLSAQTITWQRSYRGLGPVGFESLNSIVQTPDSGFIAVGNTRPGGGAGSYMMAMRLNKFGDSVWFRKFDMATAVRIIRVTDGNYVVASIIGDLVKIDLNGDTLWTRRSVNSSIRINSLKESTIYELITVGSIGISYNPTFQKSDKNGNLIFERTYLDYSFTQLSDVAFDNETYIFSGFKMLGSYLQMMICDSKGNIMRDRTLQSPWFRPASLVISVDKHLIVGGDSKPHNGEGISASLMKLDSALNVVWQHTYDNGEPQFGYCTEMVMTSDGGFAIAGSTSRDSVYVLAPKARLVKTDSDGNLLLYVKYGFDSISAGNLDGAFIDQTTDGGFVIGGSRDNGEYSYHIVKTDSVGTANPVGINGMERLANKSFYLYQNYPNPFNASTVVKFKTPRTSLITISLYDVLGRKLKTIANGSFSEGFHEVLFSAVNIPSGVYYYEALAEDLRSVKKLVIVK